MLMVVVDGSSQNQANSQSRSKWLGLRVGSRLALFYIIKRTEWTLAVTSVMMTAL